MLQIFARSQVWYLTERIKLKTLSLKSDPVYVHNVVFCAFVWLLRV